MSFFDSVDSLLEDIAQVGGDLPLDFDELPSHQPDVPLVEEKKREVTDWVEFSIPKTEESKIEGQVFYKNTKPKLARTLSLSEERSNILSRNRSPAMLNRTQNSFISPASLKDELRKDKELPRSSSWKKVGASDRANRHFATEQTSTSGTLSMEGSGGTEEDMMIPWDLPPVITDIEKKFVHEPMGRRLEEVFIIDKKDIYDDKFYSNIHLNFIGTHIKRESEKDHFIVSVLKQPTDGKYCALKTHKKGSDPFFIDKEKIDQILESKETEKGKPNLSEKLEAYLRLEYPNMDYYSIENANFPHALRQVEKKHPQRQKAFKIAFLYANGTEKTLQHFFNHREDNIEKERYFRFLNLLGERISLLGWKKYRGDIGVEIDQDSYYTEWKEIEIMFHVCLWMNAEQHRRLIGNDVVFIIFHDTKGTDTKGQSFDPGPLDALGTVPQVFGVVQEWEENYRIGFFSRPTIKPYHPPVPELHIFKPEELKDFLFTKVYNGYCQALSCPPMNRLFEVPRANTIAELVAKYPRTTIKDMAMIEKAEKKRRQILNERIKDPLLLLVTINSIEISKPTSSLYVSMTILENEMKSKTSKDKSNKIEFEHEILPFNVIAVDPALHYMKVVLKVDKGPKNKKHTQVAEAEISFREICKNLSTSAHFPLEPESKLESDQMSVSINLSFMLKGPAAALCPVCQLFLGSADLIVYKDYKYHHSCVTCTKCSKPTADDFKLRNSEFFCRKCFAKNFDGNFDEDDEAEGPRLLTVQGTSKHKWIENTFRSALSWCHFCSDLIGFNTVGFVCSECKYSCHKECKDQIPSNCGQEEKKSVSTVTTETLTSVGEDIGRHVNTVRRKSIKNVTKLISSKKGNEKYSGNRRESKEEVEEIPTLLGDG